MARIINNKHLFIHVAKTGGTFVREVLNYYGVPNWESGAFEIEDHYSISQVLEAHPELKSLKSFGFVRHPVSWYRSRWAYAKMTYFKEKCHFIPEARQHWMYPVWSDDLNRFVENTLFEYPHIATTYFQNMLGPFDRSGLARVDKVYRFEDMDAAITSLLASHLRHAHKPTLDKIGAKKSSKSVGGQISPELVKLIEEAERPLMEAFY